METSLKILLVILGVVIIWFISVYNTVINYKNTVKNSFAGIDVQLKRRADLIPNLLNVVKGYMSYEKEVFEKITHARTEMITGDINTKIKGEQTFSNSVKSIFAVAEAYPELKSNQNFLKLQEEISETEDQIEASREIFNENVKIFNTKIETFPNSFVASICNFKKFEHFIIKQNERKNIEVKF